MNSHAQIEVPVNPEKLFLSSFDLKALFGGKSDMWLWRHAKDLPAPVKIGKRRFYPKDEVEAYRKKLLEDRLATPAPTPVGRKSKRNNSK